MRTVSIITSYGSCPGEFPPAERETSGASPKWLRDEAFSEVTGERVLSFRDLSLGGTAAIPESGIGQGQNSPRDKSHKRPARSLEPQEKASSLSIIVQQIPTLLDPGSVEPIRALHQSGGFGN